jgi:VanZ family protein
MKIPKIVKAGLFFCVAFGIAILSLLPPKQVELGSSDKLSHFIAYFILMLSFGIWREKNKHLFVGILLMVAYGILLEFLQGLVPGRVPSFLDVIANTGGVVLGACMFYFLTKRRT